MFTVVPGTWIMAKSSVGFGSGEFGGEFEALDCLSCSLSLSKMAFVVWQGHSVMLWCWHGGDVLGLQ